jgi:hypothetical protein
MHTTIGRIAKITMENIKADMTANFRDLAKPIRRARKTLKETRIMFGLRREEIFIEKNLDALKSINAPIEDALKKSKNPFITHHYYRMGLEYKFARELLTEPIKELKADVEKFGDKSKYPDPDYSAQYRAAKIALNLRTDGQAQHIA